MDFEMISIMNFLRNLWGKIDAARKSPVRGKEQLENTHSPHSVNINIVINGNVYMESKKNG